MKKIGIITFHRSYNCGSILQCLAMQSYLRENGAESEVIDFSNAAQRKMYSVLFWPKKPKEVLRNILNFLFYPILKKQNTDYKRFIEKYLILSKKKTFASNEVNVENYPYDCYVTGSDQVWNVKAVDFDEAYMLPLVKNKVAYAVSLGATNLSKENDSEKYKKYISEFSAVSVREQNAANWISAMGCSTPAIAVDPTMLIPDTEWEKYAAPRIVKEKYIFWYAMTYKSDVSDVVKKISEKYNLPVYIIDGKEWSRRLLFLKGIHISPMGGPAAYLSLVKHADLVITSSFHGTVFCSKFKKNFWYLDIHSKKTDDDRASFFLRQLGLLDRYVSKDLILEKDLTIYPDYSSSTRIDDDIESSKKFIKDYILK